MTNLCLINQCARKKETPCINMLMCILYSGMCLFIIMHIERWVYLGWPTFCCFYFIYLSIYMNIFTIKQFCTECIFDFVCILFTDLIKAYVFLVLPLKTILENNIESLGIKNLKFKRYLNFPCNCYLCNILLYISLVFIIIRRSFHSFTKTRLFCNASHIIFVITRK